MFFFGLGIGDFVDDVVIIFCDGYLYDNFYVGDKGYSNDEVRFSNYDDSDFVVDFMIMSEIELIGVMVYSFESNDVLWCVFVKGLVIFFGIIFDEVVIMDVTLL